VIRYEEWPVVFYSLNGMFFASFVAYFAYRAASKICGRLAWHIQRVEDSARNRDWAAAAEIGRLRREVEDLRRWVGMPEPTPPPPPPPDDITRAVSDMIYEGCPHAD
jgi:hypothetical protein